MTTFSRACASALFALGLSSCTGRGVQTPSGLVGQPLSQSVGRYGAPTDEGTFTVRPGDDLVEFQSGLYAAVIDTMTAGTEAQVRQMTWTGGTNRAVWAVDRGGEWIIVDALEWDSDVEF